MHSNAAPMAQAIDIDVDDANRLPTHWLHAAYAGADAPALIAARKAEVAGLFLGDAKERGVRDACARGDSAPEEVIARLVQVLTAGAEASA